MTYMHTGTILTLREVCGSRTWDMPGYYLDGVGSATRLGRAAKREYDTRRARQMRENRKRGNAS